MSHGDAFRALLQRQVLTRTMQLSRRLQYQPDTSQSVNDAESLLFIVEGRKGETQPERVVLVLV